MPATQSTRTLPTTQQVEDEQLGTTLRVAGGWVRDKVLGQWSPDGHVDIDIALDNMMGSEVRACACVCVSASVSVCLCM
jgi:tRNA nucleotidyltransferase/poly(A) polymerase